MYHPRLGLAGWLLCVIGASLTAAMTVSANDVINAVQGDDVTIPELTANDMSMSILTRIKRGSDEDTCGMCKYGGSVEEEACYSSDPVCVETGNCIFLDSNIDCRRCIKYKQATYNYCCAEGRIVDLIGSDTKLCIGEEYPCGGYFSTEYVVQACAMPTNHRNPERFRLFCGPGYSLVGAHCYRDVPTRECRMSSEGYDYHGRVNKTKSGRTCQAWSSQKPHKHSCSHGGEENYCRNSRTAPPGCPESKPWCYTIESKRWEFCDIPMCERP